MIPAERLVHPQILNSFPLRVLPGPPALLALPEPLDRLARPGLPVSRAQRVQPE